VYCRCHISLKNISEGRDAILYASGENRILWWKTSKNPHLVVEKLAKKNLKKVEKSC